MANMTMFPARSRDPETCFLFGTVLVGTTGAVTSQTSNGFTVAITATTGEYTVTLDDPFPELLYADVCALAATDEFSMWSIDASAISTTGIVTIRHANQSTATHVAAWPASGNSFKIMIVCKNSTVSP
jgi:hypothetical protein